MTAQMPPLHDAVGRAPEFATTATRLVILLRCARFGIGRDRDIARTCIARAVAAFEAETEGNTAHRATPSGLADWQIARVQEFVNASLHEPVSVEALSRIVHLSASHFSRAFKQSFGEAPHAYLVTRRLVRAVHLMLTTETPLSGVAATCGFADQAHFCRQFRRHYGQTPGAWRRESKSAKCSESRYREAGLDAFVMRGALGQEEGSGIPIATGDEAVHVRRQSLDRGGRANLHRAISGFSA
jgi:AraC-like DNA-binding protein